MTMNFTELTLAEQLKISDRDIESRKRLIEFNDNDVEILKSVKPLVLENIDNIVGEFYSKQIDNPEIQLLIGDAETFKRLHNSMKRYVVELFEGFYDQEYVNKRLRIGLVHKRIGVSPKLYIAAIHILEGVLRKYIFSHPSDNGNCQQCLETQESLRKVIAFDIQFVFDTYINSLVSEVESAKNEVEEYANSLKEIVAQRTKELHELSIKDPLTSLYNQRFFHEQLRKDLAVAEREGHPISLMYLDLNSFKQLNDTHGHRAGDELLFLVGKILNQTAARPADSPCRYGGDEFCVILPNTTILDTEIFCKRLISNFDTENTSGVSFSIGIAQLGPEKYTGVDDFIRMADAQMYLSKHKSKESPGHHICYENMKKIT